MLSVDQFAASLWHIFGIIFLITAVGVLVATAAWELFKKDV
jgi:hypothetical protein